MFKGFGRCSKDSEDVQRIRFLFKGFGRGKASRFQRIHLYLDVSTKGVPQTFNVRVAVVASTSFFHSLFVSRGVLCPLVAFRVPPAELGCLYC